MDAGGISVSAFLEGALYAPGAGFYERGGRAGRRGDFVTSPEAGPLFGAVLARELDRWWHGLGRPDPFVVHEHGAGPGTLARGLVQAGPACGPALRLAMVERSTPQRALHPDHLPHVGDLGAADGRDGRWTVAGGGPWVASAATRPDGRAHVVLANELLDNLPCDLAERTREGWSEVRLVAPSAGDGAWAEVLVPVGEERSARLAALVPDAPVGARAPLQDAAADWVAASLAQLAPGGRLLVIDYGQATAALAARPWTDWVRTYRGQGRGGPPFVAAGTQDVTVEVASDQLGACSRPPDRDDSQADALRRWGIDELVAEGRAAWEDPSAPLDLATLRLRSRLAESQVLLDPAGLGAFRVWEWQAPR